MKEKLGCNVTYLKADIDAVLPYAVYSKTETFSEIYQNNDIKNIRIRIDLYTQSPDHWCICEFDIDPSPLRLPIGTTRQNPRMAAVGRIASIPHWSAAMDRPNPRRPFMRGDLNCEI